MHGFLDESDLAFLTVPVGGVPFDFIIDTGFSGTMIIGEELFDPATGTAVGTMKAELADEHIANYDTFSVVIEWFGEPTQLLILVGPGTTCLLGTDMLRPHRLEIDYDEKTAELKRSAKW